MKQLLFAIGLFGLIFFIEGCSHNVEQVKTATSSTPAPADISVPAKTTSPAKTPAPAVNTSPTVNISAPAAETSAPQKPQLRVISLDAGNLYFKPQKLTLTLNQPVKINYTNKGEHTFTVNELGVNKVLKTDASGSFTFTPKKKGKFELYCATPGHREAGMIGAMEVVD